MAVNWTSQQQQAIYEKGCNIVVSAGAGSGKTAVLSERVLQHILKDHYDVDQLLVLTFTNAAANSMKSKIKKTIEKNSELSPFEKQQQLNKIDSSYITTFDAFALALVKKYHYLLDLDREISIINSGVFNMAMEDYLDQIMLEHYENQDPVFLDMINRFCVKDDMKIRQFVAQLQLALSQIYDRQQYVQQYEQHFYSQENLEKWFQQYQQSLIERIHQVSSDLNQLSQQVDIEKIYQNIEDFLAVERYEEIYEYAKKIVYKNLPRGADDQTKKRKESITKEIKAIAKAAELEKSVLIQEYWNTKNDCLCLLQLAEQLDQRLQEYKKRIGQFEFTDIFKKAIDIVEKFPQERAEIKASFKEILIDEYQDTNDLQERFIANIENNNVYMVGDIKQSIYRFRNANPTLFQEKYQAYLQHDGGMVIDLLANFRSRKEVLDDINVLFSQLMSLTVGGADYCHGHEMVAGRKEYDLQGKTQQNQHLEFLRFPYPAQKKERSYPFTELSIAEVEAFVIGYDIKKKIAEKYQVYAENPVSKKMELRPCCYSDFCILIDRATQFEQYKQIMTYLDIPLAILQEEKMNDSDLLATIKAIFHLISCYLKQDFGYEYQFYLASLARSFLVQMSDDELFLAIKQQKQDFDCLDKIQKIANRIQEKSITDVLKEILILFDVYRKLALIGDVKENQVKIQFLYSLAHQLSKMGLTYEDFIEYLDRQYDGQQKDLTFQMAKTEVDAVNLMTIHKSKGLEFTICYYAGLSKDFNDDEKISKMVFHKKYGVIIQNLIKERGLKSTFVSELVKRDFDREDIAEKIRLLYVALTRAREKMIAVGPLEDESVDEVYSDQAKLSKKNFIELLNPLYDQIAGNCGMSVVDVFNHPDYQKMTFSKQYRMKQPDYLAEIKPQSMKVVVKKMEEIVPEPMSQSHYSKKTGLIDATIKGKLAFGSQIHYYLETLDFVDPDYSNIPDRYVGKIKAFLSSELMTNVKEGKCYKEFEFIYFVNQQKKHGFIDLLVEYSDHFDVIDYKLKNIDDENYQAQLNGYRQYLNTISSKEVRCYLYSILDSEIREVK